MNRLFDRSSISVKPLSERKNKLDFEQDRIDPDTYVPLLDAEAAERVARAAAEIRAARTNGAPVILAFGAHSIKNGLSPVMIRLMKGGWATHFATNGAGVIHDWEFAFQGLSGESVRENAPAGIFGAWDETGRYLNLAVLVGAAEGLGFGESIGRMIAEDRIVLPQPF